MKIHKGDQVIVRSGKDKGKKAEVVRAFPRADKVILEGVNVAKRHSKPTRATQQGGVIDKFMPVHVSSVALWCKSHDGPARVGAKIDKDGEKLRAALGRMQHPAILPWPSGPPVIGRANQSARHADRQRPRCRTNCACIPHAPYSRGRNRAQCISGEYPAARSMICNVLHRCERGNQGAGDAETQA